MARQRNHVQTSRRCSARQRATKRSRSTRKRLAGVERLECRRLLAGELGDQWEWFETFDTPRIAPAALSRIHDPSPAVMGPHLRLSGEWIVQLTEAGTEEVTALQSADDVIDSPSAHFDVIAGLGAPGLMLVRGTAVSLQDIEMSLSGNHAVEHFQSNRVWRGQADPNESDFQSGQLFGLESTEADRVWETQRGSTSVVVGVLDTGIDATHPDLFLNIWLNQGEIPTIFRDQLVDIDQDNRITFYDLNNVVVDPITFEVSATDFANGPNSPFVTDRNGNGRIDALDLLDDPLWADGRDTDSNQFFDDLFGVNFRAGGDDPFLSNNPSDGLGHGTHVAGTIGAIGNNGVGVVGMNWRTSLMSLRILDNNNEADTGSALQAVNYASAMRRQLQFGAGGRVESGANVRVLNNSWGQPGGFEKALDSAIRNSGEEGILFVAAAGNGNILGNGVNNDLTPFYPASYESDNVVSVAALTGTNELTTFSNFGSRAVDIGAPGAGIRSTLPGRVIDGVFIDGGYGPANGTSMATPHVSGAAALVWSALPFASVEDVKSALLQSTLSINTPVGTPPATLVSSGGRLSAFAALTADVYAPFVALNSAPDVVVEGGQNNEIAVEFSHLSGIDPNEIDDLDILVQRTWGKDGTVDVSLKPGSVEPSGNGFQAVFVVNAPGGTWDVLDFGDYEITVREGAVKSARGSVPNREKTLGRFRVQIEQPGVFYVNTQLDTDDANLGDGLAVDVDGNTSLRAAVQESNQRSVSTIILEAGHYLINQSGTDEDSGFSGDLDILNTTFLVGDTRGEVTITTETGDRLFDVRPGGQLSIQRVALLDGESVGDGGAIRASGSLFADDISVSNSVAQRGGAIAINRGGFLSLTGNSAIENNRATNVDTIDIKRVGGAIFFDSSTTGIIDGATIASNATDGIAQLRTFGVNLSNRSQALVTLRNVTVSQNTENGIFALGAVDVDHATIVGNGRFGINFYDQEAFVFDNEPDAGQLTRVRNSILIQNVGPSIGLAFGLDTPETSEGGNIAQDTSGGFALDVFKEPTDRLVEDPTGIVQPLDFYGSDTRYHPLAVNSVGIDNALPGVTIDQLGSLRPADGDGNGSSVADVGAIEAGQNRIVRGRVYEDLNRNRARDLNEPGIVNRRVFIDLNENGAPDLGEPLAVTGLDDPRTPSVNEQGSFFFNNVPGDSVTVRLIPSRDFVVSEPTIQRLSETSEGVGGNLGSGVIRQIQAAETVTSTPSISETGRFILFRSVATNLPGRLVDRGSQNVSEPTADAVFSQVAGNGRMVHVLSESVQHPQGSCTPFVSEMDGVVEPVGGDFLCGQTFLPIEFVDRVPIAISPDGSAIAYLTEAGSLSITNAASTITINDVFFNFPQMAFSGDGRSLIYSPPSGSNQPIKRFSLETQTLETILPSIGSIDSLSSNSDGTVVAFESKTPATIFSPSARPDANLDSDIFVLREGVVRRVSLTANGSERTGDSSGPTISNDGDYVSFSSIAPLVSNDTNGATDVYVYSLTAEEPRLVTVAADGANGNQASQSAVMSADGRFVSYVSLASNLIERDVNGFPDVFLSTNPFLGILNDGFGDSVSIDLSGSPEADFSLVARPGAISGTVYEDTLPNGEADLGEPGFPGLQVYLDLNRNGELDDDDVVTTTDTDGKYAFTDIASNVDYSLAVEGPIGFRQITFAGNALNREFFLPPGTSLVGRDFGFRLNAATGQSGDSSLSGRIFTDKNDDGLFNEGDVPLANAEVFLDSQNRGVRDVNEPRTITQADGTYQFDGLGNRVVSVTAFLDDTDLLAAPLGNSFELTKQPLFDQQRPFGNPQAIIAAHFNDDEFLDVGVALSEANTVSIRMNDGAGGFLADEIDVDLGVLSGGPTALVSGDFNGNGLIDIAVTANLSANVTVLLDFEENQFRSIERIPVGLEPLDIATGDFNRDGVVDLVAVNQAEDSISVLINDGSGAFSPLPSEATLGSAPVSVVVGRFNDDLLDDIAVLHSASSDRSTVNGVVSVFLATNLGFDAPATFPVGAISTDLVSADFDGDGRPDLASSNFGTNTISILRGQLDGSFVSQATQLGTASGAFDIAAADIDGDNDVDLLASNLVNRNISIFRNVGTVNGESQFEPLDNIGLGEFAFAQRMPLVVADFDLDRSGPNQLGTNDIVTVPTKTDTLHVLRNALVDGSHRVQLTGINQVRGLDFNVVPAKLDPRVNAIPSQFLLEDAPEQLVTASGINKGRDSGPELVLFATSSDPTVLPSPQVEYFPATKSAQLSYRPIADRNGTVEVTLTVRDAGADALHETEDDTFAMSSFEIEILAVNDAPDITFSSSTVTVGQDSGENSISNFVLSRIPGGSADESSQNVFDSIEITDPSIFDELPTIDLNGTLRFRPNSDATGLSLVKVTVADDGGVENGGADSTTRSFAIAVESFAPQSIVLSGDGNTLFLTQPDSQLDGVQLIDIRGTGNNTLVVDVDRIEQTFPNQDVLVLSDAGDQIEFDPGWQYQDAVLQDGQLVRRFVNRDASIRVIGPRDFTNPIDRFDVNGNGSPSSLDALQIINELGSRLFSDGQAGILRPLNSVNLERFRFYDIDQNERITSLDALLVINQLGRLRSDGSGEQLSQLFVDAGDGDDLQTLNRVHLRIDETNSVIPKLGDSTAYASGHLKPRLVDAVMSNIDEPANLDQDGEPGIRCLDQGR